MRVNIVLSHLHSKNTLLSYPKPGSGFFVHILRSIDIFSGVGGGLKLGKSVANKLFNFKR